MGFFDFFKKKGNDAPPANVQENTTKEDIFRMIMEQQAQKSPSDQFASGAVFDIFRQNRDAFDQIIRSNDTVSLRRFFANSYSLFLNNPQVVGFVPGMVNKDNNDTDPATWNADVVALQSGDHAVILFMPIQSDMLAARIVGIICSEKRDGYYYCMLNKNEDEASDVIRNKAMLGIETVGAVKGLGFELMDGFLNCIKEEYYRSK